VCRLSSLPGPLHLYISLIKQWTHRPSHQCRRRRHAQGPSWPSWPSFRPPFLTASLSNENLITHATARPIQFHLVARSAVMAAVLFPALWSLPRIVCLHSTVVIPYYRSFHIIAHSILSLISYYRSFHYRSFHIIAHSIVSLIPYYRSFYIIAHSVLSLVASNWLTIHCCLLFYSCYVYYDFDQNTVVQALRVFISYISFNVLKTKADHKMNIGYLQEILKCCENLTQMRKPTQNLLSKTRR